MRFAIVWLLVLTLAIGGQGWYVIKRLEEINASNERLLTYAQHRGEHDDEFEAWVERQFASLSLTQQAYAEQLAEMEYRRLRDVVRSPEQQAELLKQSQREIAEAAESFDTLLSQKPQQLEQALQSAKDEHGEDSREYRLALADKEGWEAATKKHGDKIASIQGRTAKVQANVDQTLKQVESQQAAVGPPGGSAKFHFTAHVATKAAMTVAQVQKGEAEYVEESKQLKSETDAYALEARQLTADSFSRQQWIAALRQANADDESTEVSLEKIATEEADARRAEQERALVAEIFGIAQKLAIGMAGGIIVAAAIGTAITFTAPVIVAIVLCLAAAVIFTIIMNEVRYSGSSAESGGGDGGGEESSMSVSLAGALAFDPRPRFDGPSLLEADESTSSPNAAASSGGGELRVLVEGNVVTTEAKHSGTKNELFRVEEVDAVKVEKGTVRGIDAGSAEGGGRRLLVEYEGQYYLFLADSADEMAQVRQVSEEILESFRK